MILHLVFLTFVLSDRLNVVGRRFAFNARWKLAIYVGWAGDFKVYAQNTVLR